MRHLSWILVSALTLLTACQPAVTATETASSSSASRSTWSISGSTFTHDPSIIYESAYGLYWMFYTADGIGVKYSTDGKTWYAGTSIFSSMPSWWTTYVPSATLSVWAPSIHYYNGYYWLYYSVSTWGSNVSLIGLQRCTSIYLGDWVDMGLVTRSTANSAYNCIDPSFVLAGSTPYLVFGSFYDGIYVTKLSSSTMKPNSSTFTQIATRNLSDSTNAIEGPMVQYNSSSGYYYLLTSFDYCCNGTSSTYSIRYGRSTSITGPYVDQDGTSMLEGGGTTLLATSGTKIGPGGQCVFTTASGSLALGYHYYDSSNSGTATLGVKDLKYSSAWLSF